jgi:hypothetical protein
MAARGIREFVITAGGLDVKPTLRDSLRDKDTLLTGEARDRPKHASAGSPVASKKSRGNKSGRR